MERAIYRKTNKGTETIEQRRHALTGRMRGVLIMVDGFTPRARLEERLAALGTPVNALDQLLAEGFIEVVEAAQPVAPTMPAGVPGADSSVAVAVPTSARSLASTPASAPSTPGKGPKAPRCPLRKPVCNGMDCAMSYGCAAKQGL